MHMRRKIFALLFTVSLTGLSLLTSCWLTPSTYTYVDYEPVYMPVEELRSSVEALPSRSLVNPGKIWVYNQYLLINERGEGIHVIDNSNPSSPQFVSFLAIPGNGDMSVRENILYADSYIDLVALDISDPVAAREVGRVENIFPQTLENTGIAFDPDRGVIVDWKEVTVEVEGGDDSRPIADGRPFQRGGGVITANDASAAAPGTSGELSVGGSMARFTIVNGILYVVDSDDLQLFTLTEPSRPAAWAKVNVGWGIETIFAYGNKLFIGSQRGMFIYDNSNPLNPTQLAEFLHVRSCDPVVADDKYAYVTLRTGTACARGSNQLDIIDIGDIRNPQLLKSYAMQNPHGLAIVGNTLYICDGEAGLKVFDAENRSDIKLETQDASLETYDIIPVGSLAIVIGPDGLHQYDCSDPSNIQKLSVIAPR